MNDSENIDSLHGEMTLSIVLLYWSLHDRLDCVSPHLSKQERLFLIRLASPLRMGNLAKIMQALPSTLTTLADGLEAQGLVQRQRDPDDRRAWLLELTQTGHAARRELLESAGLALREATGLPDADLETFSALLFRIRDHILAQGLPKGMPF
ncbi:transcriptional regulator, MarR family [Sulfitobacter brevis]|uniref:Transcriptional regulator, MarR family n=1 Tax=Sulfitobacter brevis TaxID=74348 RepID=A0A1I1SRV5_9RHOB|nr:MarR family transcriptional regulator [Sulfitobacter brevis]SFD49167.1 transcriptional regulator, MarR family [Sulfitobacter brevis]